MPEPDWAASIARLEAIVQAHDRAYLWRFAAQDKAMRAALTAIKEQTQASFKASERAIEKAEEAQRSYNQTHNDLSRKMEDQNKATMPRLETESRFLGVEEKITTLRESKSNMDGRMLILGIGGSVVISVLVALLSRVIMR